MIVRIRSQKEGHPHLDIDRSSYPDTQASVKISRAIGRLASLQLEVTATEPQAMDFLSRVKQRMYRVEVYQNNVVNEDERVFVGELVRGELSIVNMGAPSVTLEATCRTVVSPESFEPWVEEVGDTSIDNLTRQLCEQCSLSLSESSTITQARGDTYIQAGTALGGLKMFLLWHGMEMALKDKSDIQVFAAGRPTEEEPVTLNLGNVHSYTRPL